MASSVSKKHRKKNSGMTATPAADTQVDTSDVTRWMELFGYDGRQAIAAIVRHRNDPSVHVSNKKWSEVQFGHEKAGYNKEAYEHLLVLKALASREKKARYNGLELCEWVGEYSRICLEGYLTLDSLTQILGEEDIGTVDTEEKWCYIRHNRINENKILAWVKQVELVVARGKKSYNEVWKAAVSEKKESTVLTRAGFHSVPPSSKPDDNDTDIRVGFIRLDDDELGSYQVQIDTRTQYVRNPFVDRSRLIYSIAELNGLQPSRQPRLLPPQHWPSSSLGPALPPWNLVGMALFWQHYRTDPHIQLSVFGNAPRVFPLPGEVVTVTRARPSVSTARGHSTMASETLQISSPNISQQLEHHHSTGTRSTRRLKRLVRLHGGRALRQLNQAVPVRSSRAHRMEELFGDDGPQTVSDMTIREIVVATALRTSKSTRVVNSSIDTRITSPELAEMWSQFYVPSTSHFRLQAWTRQHSSSKPI
ncbi:hypothetical protein BKA65DRAFT_574798 [Rhexocercosporidium sp. MPI-PUGE-AT-0058]|nr:hypothetical protein BKA65DRAFT_574798 [Rhexocercosporidium sp. MPI-PUGE-AT-0058]